MSQKKTLAEALPTPTPTEARSIAHRLTAGVAPDPWLTKDEAADYLRVTTRSIERYCDEGLLPAYRLGPRLTRFRLSDLDAMVVPIEPGEITKPEPETIGLDYGKLASAIESVPRVRSKQD